MATVTNDPVALSARSYAIAQRVIAGVHPEQLDLPTPCSEWDVRAVINHLIGAHFYFAASLRGESIDMSAAPPDFAANNPAATYAGAAEEMLKVWREPGVMDRTVETLVGPIPAPVLIGMWCNDNLVHAWDLARATGQDDNLDPDLAGQMLDMLRQMPLPRGE